MTKKNNNGCPSQPVCRFRCRQLLSWLVMLLLVCRLQPVQAQSISVHLKNTNLAKVVAALQEQAPQYVFSYLAEPLQKVAIEEISIHTASVIEALQLLQKKHRLQYLLDGKMISLRFAPAAAGPAREGTLTGRIIDEENGMPVSGATIVIGGKTVTSDVDGRFRLPLPVGNYTARISFVGYGAKQITEIPVQENNAFQLNVTLTREAGSLGGIMVTSSSARRESVTALYVRQKNATGITDGISAEQITRTPDKNIGESLRRISGLNVLENRYVVVRGLGERYNGAMLNGQLLPSTELNRKQFSFDIIPANVVDNVTVYKTVMPDKSAEFGGGLVEVNTKTLPDENYLNVTVGGTVNDKTTGKLFRAQALSTSAYFGSAGADRNLFGRNDWKNVDEIRAYYKAAGEDPKLLSNNWRLYNYTPAASPNMLVDFGHVFSLKHNRRLGIMASLSYRNTWQTSDVHMGRNGYPGNESMLEEKYGYTGKRYGFTTNLGGILGVGYSATTWKAGWQTMFLRTYDQQLQLGTGVKNDYGEAFGLYDLTTQTYLVQQQLKGEKTFGKKGIRLDWLASYTYLDRRKPDNHQFDARYVGDGKNDPSNKDADFSIANPQSNLLSAGVLRSWSRSTENNFAWNADFTVPVKWKLGSFTIDNRFKAGYAGWSKDRMFWIATTASQNFNNGNYEPLSQVFDPATHPDGKITISDFSDQYSKNTALHAGYLMLDTRLGRHVRLVGGARGEYYDINSVNTLMDRFVATQQQQNHDLTDYSDLYALEPAFNWFPAASLIYSLTRQMNLRFNYSKSIIRPDLRELSYFKEFDFELGGAYWSNTPVRSTKITHFDFRYEWYPGPGEVISVSAFYKKLLYPMEVFETQDRIFELKNDKSAKNSGFEIELRKSLAFTGVPVVKHITLYGNFSRLFAKVIPMEIVYRNLDPNNKNKLMVVEKELPEVERPQAGASNYTYNASVLYDASPVSLTLSYNYITNRVFRAAGVNGNALFETPLPSLDAQLSYQLLKNRASVRVNISNLLDCAARVYQKRSQLDTNLLFERGDFINYQTMPGRTYGLSFNYKF